MASQEELQELLALARERLPQPYREDGPPLGIFFDPVPAAEAPGSRAAETAGEKRKRVMIDDYEMEGGEGGDLNVTRMVRTPLPGLNHVFHCPVPAAEEACSLCHKALICPSHRSLVDRW